MMKKPRVKLRIPLFVEVHDRLDVQRPRDNLHSFGPDGIRQHEKLIRLTKELLLGATLPLDVDKSANPVNHQTIKLVTQVINRIACVEIPSHFVLRYLHRCVTSASCDIEFHNQRRISGGSGVERDAIFIEEHLRLQ